MTATAREALHSSKTDDHGTPPEYVEMARDIMGGIDLDPFSSSYWNHHIVKARSICDGVTRDGFAEPWWGRVFINHPGVPRSGNTRRSWAKLVSAWTRGEVETALWVGFRLDQLAELQSEAVHPLQMFNLIPRERVCYMIRNGSGPPIRSKDPTHSSYFTLLPTRASVSQARTQLEKFRVYSESLIIGGALIRPV